MKRISQILIAACAAMALTGAMLALTAGSPDLFREGLGRGLLAVSVVGMAVCVVMRPKAAEAACAQTGLKDNGYHPECTFDDVAANDEAQRSLRQLRDYLKEPERYSRLGARMPRGVLLYGPPGTGKTLLARALAGEAGVPFFALSGSDFVEKYVGVGAMRVRDLFKKARKAGKCVIFIDEIDAMGKKRHDQSSDERDQTLNALLSEMSGFRTGDGILVLAATNRIEMLDPALLRPGRFDRQIEVGLPGLRERRSILELHSRNKPMEENVDLERLARETVYFSGASLENLLNEAAIAAVERGSERINMEDLKGALIRSVVGSEHESAADPQERRIIAIHEAGHALAARLLTPEYRVSRVSILPAGRGAAGYSLTVPPEKVMVRRSDLENQICVLLAGRAAELAIFGEEAVTAGASSDLARATELAAKMAGELGMAGEAAVSLKALSQYCGSCGDVAEKTREILASLLARTGSLLADNADTLGRLAGALLERETLDEIEVDELLFDLSNDRQSAAG